MDKEDLLNILEAQQLALIAIQQQILEMAEAYHTPDKEQPKLLNKIDDVMKQLTLIRKTLSKYRSQE